MSENILIPNAQEYKELNNAKSTSLKYDALSICPDWAPNEHYTVTSNEYWPLSKFLDIIGVTGQNKRYFSHPLTLDMAIGQNTPKDKEVGKQNFKELVYHHIVPIKDNTDLALSRYAALMLDKEIGKTIPTDFSQAYLIQPNYSMVQLYRMSQQTERINLCARVHKINDTLDGIFKSLGASYSQHYKVFNHQRIQWLFNNKRNNNNITKAEIIKQRQLFPNVKKPTSGKLASPTRTYLYDYMDTQLLQAYINAMEAIIEKWDNNPQIHNYFAWRDMTSNALNSIVSHFICNGFSTPNAHLCQYGVKTIEQKRHEYEIAFAKNYINTHLR